MRTRCLRKPDDSQTNASIRRAILAAQKAGLRVTGIRADGTVLVQNDDNPLAPYSETVPTSLAPSKWDDVEA
jgi:hypothetical protein